MVVSEVALAIGVELVLRRTGVSLAALLFYRSFFALLVLATYVRPGRAERVLITARRRTRIVIVRLNDEGAEGLSVRRTRVLLVPADEPASHPAG